MIGEYSANIAFVVDSLKIPYIVTSPIEPCYVSNIGKYVIQMVPQHRTVSQLVMDLMQSFNWNDTAVLYQSTHGRSNSKEFLNIELL